MTQGQLHRGGDFSLKDIMVAHVVPKSNHCIKHWKKWAEESQIPLLRVNNCEIFGQLPHFCSMYNMDQTYKGEEGYFVMSRVGISFQCCGGWGSAIFLAWRGEPSTPTPPPPPFRETPAPHPLKYLPLLSYLHWRHLTKDSIFSRKTKWASPGVIAILLCEHQLSYK